PLRHRLFRPPRPPPHPDARRVPGPSVAEGVRDGHAVGVPAGDLAGRGRRRRVSGAPVTIVEREFGEMALNMGPQHPSTHGVLRLVLHLCGETVLRAKPAIGYLHRGVEKLSEHLAYDQLAPVYERNDYLSPTSNSLAYCIAVERLGS